MLVSDLLDTLPKPSAFIAFVLIIASLSRDTAADVTYDLTVTPQSLAVGQSLTISVGLVNPSAPVGDIFIYIQKSGPAVIVFSNRQGSCSLSGGYTGTIDVCDFTKNRYTITFPSVTSSHNGLWSVKALLQKPSDSPQIQVVVIVPVTSVTVSPTSLGVVAKQQVTLTCNVNSDVTLPVTYTWKRTQGSSRLDPPSNAVSTTQGNGISNTLQWTAANQDGGSYDCTASNDISSKSITSSIVNVTVYYPADSVTLTTSATTAAVGTAVNVACVSVGGNPRPGLVLYREPGHQQVLAVDPPGPLNYVITLQKSDNGAKFNCETEAKLTGLVIPAQVSSTITMNVQFAPTNIQVQQTVLVDEYQIKPVKCETTTSSNPATQLVWSGPSLGTTTQGSQNVDYGVKSYNDVTMTGDRKLNSATYTCTATYMNNVIFTKTATLSVYFPPSSIVFYDTSTNAMIESQARDLHCRTDTSNPAGNVTWYRLLAGTTSPIPALVPNSTPGDNGGVVVTSDVRITPSRQENLAQYWCKVEFTYSNSTTVTREAAHITLAVYYPVNAVITISPGNDIVEGGHVTLTCETSGGNPTNPLTYTWTYNNNVLNQFTGRTLDYPSISYNQGGQYRCTVVNAGGPANADKTLDVKYKPRIDESQPQQSSQGGALKGSVTFTLIILANPAPSSATWTKGGVSLGARFTPSNVGLTYNLRVDDIQEQDYGIYTCRLVNTVGATEFNITLNPTGPPFIPSNLTVDTRTSTSITLSWTSEFSGATNQLFSLQYALIGGSWSPEVFNITDLGKGRTVRQEVTGLQPETTYKFRVGSKNNLGLISNYTPEVTNLTKVTFMLSGIAIERDGDRVTITWSVNDTYRSDYNTAVVNVSYSVERKPTPTIDGPDPGTKSVSGPFTDGRVVFDVLNGYTYVYDVTVRDGIPTLYQRLGLRISDGAASSNVTSAVVGVVVPVIIVIIIVIVLYILVRRGVLPTGKRIPEEPDEEGTENKGFMGSFDHLAQADVQCIPGGQSVSTPALSPYVDFPETKSPSKIDMLKKRLSGTGKSEERKPVFSQKIGTPADFNPYAEATFTEQPTKSSDDSTQPKPKKSIKNIFNKIKTKGGKSNGSAGKSFDSEASLYEEISRPKVVEPDRSQSGFVDDISPYGESKCIPNPSNPEPGYAEVNKPMMSNPTEPQYAKVDLSKKSTPPKPPVVFHTNTATHPSPVYNGQDHTDTAPPPPPVYAEVDLSMKSRNQPEPIYAQVDKSTNKAQQQWPQDDAVIYADVQSPSDPHQQHDGKPVRKPKPRPPVKPGSPGANEDTYANLGSMPGSDANVLYANLTNVVEKPEKPTTSVGVDGVIYTELKFAKPSQPTTVKPKGAETIYAEIDVSKSSSYI